MRKRNVFHIYRKAKRRFCKRYSCKIHRPSLDLKSRWHRNAMRTDIQKALHIAYVAPLSAYIVWTIDILLVPPPPYSRYNA